MKQVRMKNRKLQFLEISVRGIAKMIISYFNTTFIRNIPHFNTNLCDFIPHFNTK
jgi:hypothetical protein